jgi:hypothetical protein
VATFFAVLTLALLAPACRYELRDPGVTAGCGPLRYTVTEHDVGLTGDRRAAIDDAVAEFAALVGRTVESLDDSGQVASGNAPGDPVVFEFAWPDEQPAGLGFAEPHVVGSSYAGGWVMLNPSLRNAPTGVIRRLVLHELGHLHGLEHVDDPGELMDPSLAAEQWGPGDLFGLYVTHDGGCPGATLVPAFQDAIG